MLRLATTLLFTYLASLAPMAVGDDLQKNIKHYPVHGLDISRYQKQIRWTELSKTQYQFIFIKATEGGSYQDPLFKANWDNAAKHGYARGAYHFFTFCRAGKQQAANFIRTVPRDAKALPPVVDIEFLGNCKRRPPKGEVLIQVRQFLEQLELHYKRKPILYVTYESYNYYLSGNFSDYPLWVRDYEKIPTLADDRPWTFWQYSNRGRVQGINTAVDLNLFHGSVQQIKALK